MFKQTTSYPGPGDLNDWTFPKNLHFFYDLKNLDEEVVCESNENIGLKLKADIFQFSFLGLHLFIHSFSVHPFIYSFITSLFIHLFFNLVSNLFLLFIYYF